MLVEPVMGSSTLQAAGTLHALLLCSAPAALYEESVHARIYAWSVYSHIVVDAQPKADTEAIKSLHLIRVSVAIMYDTRPADSQR